MSNSPRKKSGLLDDYAYETRFGLGTFWCNKIKYLECTHTTTQAISVKKWVGGAKRFEWATKEGYVVWAFLLK